MTFGRNSGRQRRFTGLETLNKNQRTSSRSRIREPRARRTYYYNVHKTSLAP